MVALTTTSSPLAFLALLVARAVYLWLHENWDDATRERIARTRRAECARCVALLAAAVRTVCLCTSAFL